jgi:hypothetical protein
MPAGPRWITARIALSVATGVALTVLLSGPAAIAVAWLFPSGGDYSGGSVDGGRFGFGTAWSVHRTAWLFHERWEVCYMEWATPGNPDPTLTVPPPTWVLRPTRAGRDAHINSNPVSTIAAGWPFRAFSAIEWHAIIHEEGARYDYAGHEYEHGWCVRPAKALSTPAALVIPFRPIWSGLLADIAVWSGMSAFLFVVRSAARSAFRRRRNLCTACSYCRAGLASTVPCPECGAAP